MKVHNWVIGLTALILLIAMFLIVSKLSTDPSKQPQNIDKKLYVAASINPLADMVKQIGGQDVEVDTILPPGASPHTFEPTPQQIRNAQGIKLIFVIGHGLDNWTKPISDNAVDATIVTVDQNINLRQLPLDQRDEDEPDQSIDPHYWLTPTNAKIMSQNIFDALSQVDSEHKEIYAANLKSYLAKLDELNEYLNIKLSGVKDKKLITHHNAWGYFADAYSMQIIGTFEVSPGKEPTPRQIADLQNKVRQYNIKTVFSEPQLSDSSLKPFIQDLNLNIKVLDPEGGSNNMGYIELMRYNADTIAGTL